MANISNSSIVASAEALNEALIAYYSTETGKKEKQLLQEAQDVFESGNYQLLKVETMLNGTGYPDFQKYILLFFMRGWSSKSSVDSSDYQSLKEKSFQVLDLHREQKNSPHYKNVRKCMAAFRDAIKHSFPIEEGTVRKLESENFQHQKLILQFFAETEGVLKREGTTAFSQREIEANFLSPFFKTLDQAISKYQNSPLGKEEDALLKEVRELYSEYDFDSQKIRPDLKEILPKHQKLREELRQNMSIWPVCSSRKKPNNEQYQNLYNTIRKLDLEAFTEIYTKKRNDKLYNAVKKASFRLKREIQKALKKGKGEAVSRAKEWSARLTYSRVIQKSIGKIQQTHRVETTIPIDLELSVQHAINLDAALTKLEQFLRTEEKALFDNIKGEFSRVTFDFKRIEPLLDENFQQFDVRKDLGQKIHSWILQSSKSKQADETDYQTLKSKMKEIDKEAYRKFLKKRENKLPYLGVTKAFERLQNSTEAARKAGNTKRVEEVEESAKKLTHAGMILLAMQSSKESDG